MESLFRHNTEIKLRPDLNFLPCQDPVLWLVASCTWSCACVHSPIDMQVDTGQQVIHGRHGGAVDLRDLPRQRLHRRLHR